MSDVADDQLTDPQPPRQLGNYRILAEIGRGGVGVVYEAEQITLRRRVALKLLPAEVASNESNVQRFEREARAAAQMHHTNIVPVFEVGRSGSLVYYTMQLIRGCGVDDLIDELAFQRSEEKAAEAGETTPIKRPQESASETQMLLRTQIAGALLNGNFAAADLTENQESREDGTGVTDDTATISGRLTQTAMQVTGVPQGVQESESYWGRIARIGFDAAAALAHSHAQGIVHRDIKPSNLILDDKGVLWVTDFGLAMTEESNITRTGDVLGTLRYLAPERFEGRCDARSDIYALGLTLYELITLKPAFSSRNRWKLIRQICRDEPPAASSINPDVPRDLETIARKASDKDPRNRYQSATELMDDLQRYLADQPIQARQLSALERFKRWRRRNLALSNSLAMIALLLVLTAAVSLAASLREAGLRDVADEARWNAERARSLADQRRFDLQQTLYFAEMNIAGQAALANRGDYLIRRKTANWASDPEKRALRGWEWYYLRSLQDQSEWVSKVRYPLAVAWSPDDSLIAVTFDHGSLAIVDSSTGDIESSIPYEGVHDEAHLSWHPNRPLIAISHAHGLVQVWDFEQNDWAFEHMDASERAEAIIWTPDGQHLVWGSTGAVSVLNFDKRDDPAPVRIACNPVISNVLQWSPDGEQLFAANWWENKGTLIDFEKRTIMRHFPGRNVRWDPESGEVSHYLTTDAKGQITFFDPETNAETRRLTGHRSLARCLAWDKAGERLLSGGLDNAVRLWDFQTGELIRGYSGHVGDVGGIAWSADETRFCSSGTYYLRTWNVESKVQAARRNNLGVTRSVRWHPDGHVFATAHFDNLVRIWRTSDFSVIATLAGHTEDAHSIAWNARGDRLATSGRDGKIQLFDTSCYLSDAFATSDNLTGTNADAEPTVAPRDADVGSLPLLLKSWNGDSEILDVNWSPDGSRLIATCISHNVFVWNVEDTSRPVFETTFPADAHCAKWTSDGRQLILGWGRSITVLDGQNYEQTGELKLNTSVISFALSPDGNSLVAAGRIPNIDICNLKTMRIENTLRGHQGSVWCVDWSQDGRRIASSSEDGTVKIWDPVTGNEALTLMDIRPSGEIWNVQFGPQGKRLAASCAGSAVLMWDASPAMEAPHPVSSPSEISLKARRPSN